MLTTEYHADVRRLVPGQCRVATRDSFAPETVNLRQRRVANVVYGVTRHVVRLNGMMCQNCDVRRRVASVVSYGSPMPVFTTPIVPPLGVGFSSAGGSKASKARLRLFQDLVSTAAIRVALPASYRMAF